MSAPAQPLDLLTSAQLSAVPAVPHAFTTRAGGLSGGVFASLNLDYRNGDERVTIEANRRRVLDAIGRPEGVFVNPQQVHGTDVFEVTHLAGRSIQADGVFTRDPRAAVAVLVADCVPILLASADGKTVAAVHAGWRGTLAQIGRVMLERLASAKVSVAGLRAALGPAIGPCCFTLGEDVAAQLAGAPGGDSAVRRDGERWVADLWALNVAGLVAAGMARERIDVVRVCSSCSQALFSHRRDQGRTGRQAGVIAPAR